MIIEKVAQSITFSNNTAVYDGTAHEITAEGLFDAVAAVTYDGSEAAPVDAGSYAVTGIVTDTVNWNAATNTTTMTISKGDQILTGFGLPATMAAGESLALSAVVNPVASTNEPAFTVTGGSGSITGATLTVTAPGTVFVTASLAGDTNWNAAPDVTVSTIVQAYRSYRITNSIATSLGGVQSAKYSPDGNLYLFFSEATTNGAMQLSLRYAGSDLFSTAETVGGNDGESLVRSPVDIQFGSGTKMAGQSGSLGIIVDSASKTVPLQSIPSSSVTGRNPAFFAQGTAPTNHLFFGTQENGTSKVVGVFSADDWATLGAETPSQIGAGVLSGAAGTNACQAIFTDRGIYFTDDEGATLTKIPVDADAMAQGASNRFYTASVVVNYSIDRLVYSLQIAANNEALDSGSWDSAWSPVSTNLIGTNIIRHVRMAAVETNLLLCWVEGTAGDLMTSLSQDGGTNWSTPEALLDTARCIKTDDAEPGYAVAGSKNKITLIAGLWTDEKALGSLQLRAVGLTTNVILRWDAPTSMGAETDEVLIRYNTGSNGYPTLSNGINLYNGSDTRLTHSNTTQDVTYYYTLWVKNGTEYTEPTTASSGNEIQVFEWSFGAEQETDIIADSLPVADQTR
jgi:hypothetical protein